MFVNDAMDDIDCGPTSLFELSSLLVSNNSRTRMETGAEVSGLAQNQPEISGSRGPIGDANARLDFDFGLMEGFVATERKQLDDSRPPESLPCVSASVYASIPVFQSNMPAGSETPQPQSDSLVHPRLRRSQSAPDFRRHTNGDATQIGMAVKKATVISGPDLEKYNGADNLRDTRAEAEKERDRRPLRFSFYSTVSSSVVHTRSLSELPEEGQSFEELFSGRTKNMSDGVRSARVNVPPSPSLGGKKEEHTWWLDVLSPTDEDMQVLSKVFQIHPLTREDIIMEESREKIDLFSNYYLVCFRSFDQDPFSPTYLEPLNMYIIVFREGVLSFHFGGTPHPSNVRRRIKQLSDSISVTSHWISYTLIDDITNAIGYLMQGIDYEVDSIDDLVPILKQAEQSDMLRRIGTCRKKVMSLLRLVGNKADVVKGLAKRCSDPEQSIVAPKSDIVLYLSATQDHLLTMAQNLNQYENILSRSYSEYLALISIDMTAANNHTNDLLSKMTVLGAVLIPMNFVIGAWGLNVHVPGQDITEGYTWFCCIVGGLLAFGIFGGYFIYKLLIKH